MKTINELKKEIEERKLIVDKQANPEFCDGIEQSKEFCREHDIELNKLKALLKQTEEIIEMIDVNLNEIKDKITIFAKADKNTERVMVHYSLLRKMDLLNELKLSLIGEEKK